VFNKPLNIDNKTTYQGIQAWFHLVLSRVDGDSTCGSNLQANQVVSSSTQTANQAILATPDPSVQPIPIVRPRF
jgi:hypothetical protein